MDPRLTPAQALAYLRELSADVRAGAVLDARGGLLAGDAALAPAAAQLAAALGTEEAGQARRPGGAVFALRAGGRTAVLACGPHALAALVLHDLGRALEDLGAPSVRPGPPGELPTGPADALLRAAPRDLGR